MTYSQVSIERNIDTELNTEEYVVFLKDSDKKKEIFTCNLYFKRKRSSLIETIWSVDKNKTKSDYISYIWKFYTDLKEGGFEQLIGTDFDLHLQYNNEKKVYLLSDMPGKGCQLEDLLFSPKYDLSNQNFNMLRVDTSYAYFGLNTLPIYTWMPENGRFFIRSNQDISEPVSRLISSTVEDAIPSLELQPILSKIYSALI